MFTVAITLYSNEVILVDQSCKTTKVLKPSRNTIDNVWVGAKKDFGFPIIYLNTRGINEMKL